MELSNGIRMRKRVLIGISLLCFLMATISAPIPMVIEYTVEAHVNGTESGVENKAPTRISGASSFQDEMVGLAQLFGFVESVKSLPDKRSSIEVGDKESFFCRDFAKGGYYKVDAICMEIGTHCYIYVEEGQKVEESVLDDIADEFDKIIYPTNIEVFGAIPNKGTDDDMITILVLDIRDRYNTGGDHKNGYQDDEDKYDRGLIWHRHSNERKILYMDLNPLHPGSQDFFMKLAHEFQHLIHSYIDEDEETWVEEGLAQYAEYVYTCKKMNATHPLTFVEFLSTPDVNLTLWPKNEDDVKGENYGASYLFALYLIEHYGENNSFVRELMKQDKDGKEGIIETLKKYGYTGEFPNIFNTWVIANYLDDGSLSQKYEYENIHISALDNENASRVDLAQKTRFSGESQIIKHELGTEFSREPQITKHEEGTKNPLSVERWAADYVKVDLVNSPSFLRTEFSGNMLTAFNLFAILIYENDTYSVERIPLNYFKNGEHIIMESHNLQRIVYIICRHNDPIGSGEYTLTLESGYPEAWYAFIINFFDKIKNFFTETLPDFFRNLVSKEESVEEKAMKNVERELDMISKGTDLISELQKSIYELSEEEIPEEYLQFEFTYTIQGARFFTNVDEARNYMNSMGISKYDINDALNIVTELELDQLGFCIVVVDYYLNIAGDAEEGRYPVVCDEEGTPFWESWHLYEDIQEMYEEIEQESYGAEHYEAEQLVLENQDLKGTRLRICIRNPGTSDAVIVAVYRNGTFIATIDKLLRGNSTTCFELPGTYYLGDSVTLVTEEGTQIKFRVK